MTPEGSVAPTPKPHRDDTLIKALVRAHTPPRIESGCAKPITDLCQSRRGTDAPSAGSSR
jgi:hypothetical protein